MLVGNVVRHLVVRYCRFAQDSARQPPSLHGITAELVSDWSQCRVADSGSQASVKLYIPAGIALRPPP